MTMLQKDEAQMTETIMEVARGRRKKKVRKAKTRIENLDPGTTPLDFATVERTHQSSPRRNARLARLADCATICENT